MALQLILGGSGAGKSHYLYHKIIQESMEKEQTNYLVLVPEQFTMETQKDFIMMHDRHGIMNIDVLSFLRLAYRIMEETGMGDKPVLEDIGKSMVLRRVMEEKKEELIYFKSNIRKPGFVDEVKSMLSELYQYSIGEEELEAMIAAAENRPLLEAKLKDLRLIYCAFRDFLLDKYITAEEIMDVLHDALGKSLLIQNSVVCLDGFTGFTPCQYKVLTRIIKMAKKVYVTVTIDERENIWRSGEEFQLFHLSKKTIQKLGVLAKNENVEILEPIFPAKESGCLWRFTENEALASLERNLFRHPWEVYNREQNSVWIKELKTPKEEVLFVRSKIKELVRLNGYRYRDFAVVSGDMGKYARILEREFINGEVPYFLDDKREITKNPLILLINSLLTLSEYGLDYESMFHYLRCGLVPIEKEELYTLENYCLAVGIRGKKAWRNPFCKGKAQRTAEELEAINVIRKKIANGLEPAAVILNEKSQTVEAYVRGLYQFLTNLQVFEQLMKYKKQFEDEKRLLLAKEYGQVYKVVMELLERMLDLLGSETVTRKEFQEILNAGFQKAKVGLIPTGVDQVVVGDIERTRLKDIKILFFIGVNDGIVPKTAQGGGILSDAERELLKEKKVELAPTRREKVFTERFYLYLNLTKPKEKVYLTYHLTDFDGRAKKPSYLIHKIRQLFPCPKNIKIEEGKEIIKELENKLDADEGMAYLLEGIRNFENQKNTDELWSILYSWYMQEDKLRQDIIHFIQFAFPNEVSGKISKAVAKALYGEDISGSVTRLEQYAACACAHFLTYGLRLRERQEFKINAPDIGNIFHEALELFSAKLKEHNLTWETITSELREQLGEECVREVTMEYGDTIFHSTNRNEYMIERISRIVKRTLWALTKQLGAGAFLPKGYEIKFSYMDDLESVKLELDEGRIMKLKGRIDRVDFYETKEEIYIKVVDYKSGKKSFDIVDVYYGLQLQLIVYMEAMLEKTKKDNPDKNVLPAGIFYYNMDDPVIDRGEPIFLESQLLKELRVNGLVNEESAVIKALDAEFIEKNTEELSPSKKSNVIPVETVKFGQLSKTSSVAKTKEFEDLISYVRKRMITFGNEIIEGHCEKNPYLLGDKTACDYCRFQGVCGFDKKLPGDRFRVLKKQGKDDIWYKISKDGEEEE